MRPRQSNQVIGKAEGLKESHVMSLGKKGRANAMKYRLIVIATVAGALFFGGLPGTSHNQVSAQVAPAGPGGVAVADTSVFYEPLTPYGRWFQFGNYGWSWHPTAVA